MTLDNIAALFIQPPVGAWSDHLRTKLGRRVTISIGLVMMAVLLFCLYIVPTVTLLSPVSRLPLVGIPLVQGGPRMLTLAGVFLMVAGVAWSLVNINSLPMVVDMTSSTRLGTYTGLYYLFSTLSAIVGPNVNGGCLNIPRSRNPARKGGPRPERIILNEKITPYHCVNSSNCFIGARMRRKVG
ncbi:MAG TPA: hypothetical protein VMT91_09145 [Anaerolineales bacterium]|nr:hypothetical protein [Anaerolineales bacterium]